MSDLVSSARGFSEYGSFGKLAKALIGKHPGSFAIKQRSLEALISKLNKGDNTWWANNLDKAEVLAELLEASITDLGIYEKSKINLFKFDDFPELPAVDFKRYKPFFLGKEKALLTQQGRRTGESTLAEWLDRPADRFREPYDMNWLHIADSLELELITKFLEVEATFDVTFVGTLKEAHEQLLKYKAQIICVQHSDCERDLHALATRPDGAGLLVIAPFMLEINNESEALPEYTWEYMQAQGVERKQIILNAGSGHGTINRFLWEHSQDWRSRLLDWVEKYLTKFNIDTLFNAEELRQWLSRFDPKEIWFASVSDMLQLCRIGHHNSKKLPNPNAANAGERLIQALFNEHSPILSYMVQQLAMSRWEAIEQPWVGYLTIDVWMSLIPAEQKSIATAELEAIANGKTITDRHQAVNHVTSKIELGRPDILLKNGLLKKNSYGLFDLQHRTLASLLIRDELIRKITKSSLSSWSLACFDPDRRAMIDAALDAISLQDLVDFLDNILQEPTNSAEFIGASEALFMAIGRRIVLREKIPDKFRLLADLVRNRLDLTDNFDMPILLSRKIETKDQTIEWVTTCWAWSLDFPLENSSHWLFPVGSINLDEPPYWLPSLDDLDDLQNISNAWIGLLEICDQWLNDLEHPIENAPDFMGIGHLVKASVGLWPAEDKWASQTFKKRWTDEALLIRVKTMNEQALLRLWKSLVTFELNLNNKKDVISKISILYSPTRHFLLNTLEPKTALENLTTKELHVYAMWPQVFPLSYRRVLLESVKDTLNTELIDSPLKFFQNFGPTVADLLEGYLADINVSWAAANCLWAWSPDKIVNKILPNDQLSAIGRQSLLEQAPADHINAISDLMLTKSNLFSDSDCSNWARKNLPFSGSKAATLLFLIGRANGEQVT